MRSDEVDITMQGGNRYPVNTEPKPSPIAEAAAQLRTALVELKQAQTRQDAAAAAVNEAIANLRKAQR